MILRPLQIIYEGLSEFKNYLYDSQIIKSTHLAVPVISVGNLSVGGTGKTPCVCFLAEALLAKKHFQSIGIVSRSYKGQLRSPEKVDLAKPGAAQLYGDEPCLLQNKLPQCSVWSGPEKYRTAQAAITSEKLDLIIVDDGFSHRKLQRQFDIVLLDATAPIKDYQTLPIGRLREPLSQLHRAHALIITKSNLVSDEKIHQLRQLLLKQKKVRNENIYLGSLISSVGSLDPSDHELEVFCGLGHPESLRISLVSLGFKINNLKCFPDHYNYRESDLKKIHDSFSFQQENNPKLRLVTTAKDAVKFLHHPIQSTLNVIDYKLQILDNKEGPLLEKISHRF